MSTLLKREFYVLTDCRSRVKYCTVLGVVVVLLCKFKKICWNNRDHRLTFSLTNNDSKVLLPQWYYGGWPINHHLVYVARPRCVIMTPSKLFLDLNICFLLKEIFACPFASLISLVFKLSMQQRAKRCNIRLIVLSL